MVISGVLQSGRWGNGLSLYEVRGVKESVDDNVRLLAKNPKKKTLTVMNSFLKYFVLHC